MEKNKKSILGLNTVKAFIVVLLSLAIIGVVTLVILASINSDSLIAQTGVSTDVDVSNELITALDSGNYTDATRLSLVSVTCKDILVNNATAGGTSISSGNYTFTTGCLLSNVTSEFAGNEWNVNYTYNYKADIGISTVTGNVSSGVTSFFSNASTFFALLAVVVIILIISLVIVVVNRFGGGSGSTESYST